MNSRALCALAAIGLAGAVSPAFGVFTLNNGQSVGLDQILAQGSDHQVNIGDKTFTFLAYNSVAFPNTGVQIVGYIAPNPLQGTGFDIHGTFVDGNSTDALGADFTIRYTVEIQPNYIAQGYRITDAELTFDGSSTGPGSFARVDESILDYNGQPGLNLLATPAVFANGNGLPPSVLQAHTVFGPPGYTKLDITKDVHFFANGTGATAAASFVRQSFSQVPTPGAASMALLGVALIARRRRA